MASHLPRHPERLLTHPPQQVHRTWYKTLATDDPDSPGDISATFPAENAARRIIAVDWSKPGEVEITWLITAVT